MKLSALIFAGILLGAIAGMAAKAYFDYRKLKKQEAADREYAARIRRLRHPPLEMGERRDIFKEQLKTRTVQRDFIGKKAE